MTPGEPQHSAALLCGDRGMDFGVVWTEPIDVMHKHRNFSVDLPEILSQFLCIRTKGRMRFIEPAEIEAIQSTGNYVTLILANDSLIMRGSLASIEARLSEQGILRISRSTMANVKQIKELRRCVYGGYGIITKSGKELKMSRGYARKLKQLRRPPS